MDWNLIGSSVHAFLDQEWVKSAGVTSLSILLGTGYLQRRVEKQRADTSHQIEEYRDELGRVSARVARRDQATLDAVRATWDKLQNAFDLTIRSMASTV